MSVSSTLTTVAQNADSPNAARAGGDAAALVGVAAPEEVLEREVQQVAGADQFDPAEGDQLDREQRGEDAEDERAEDPVAQRLLLLMTRQPEHQNRQHERVVGAEQALQQDEEADSDEVGA